MDKQTLSNYGWLVIVTLILAVMLAFATPFGTYVGDGVVSIANGYVQSSNNATDKDNISKLEQQWMDKLGSSTPENVEHEGIIPKNAIYKRNILDDYTATPQYEILESSMAFPESVNNYDIYIYGDYVYKYYITSSGWKAMLNTDIVDKNQTSYTKPILNTINELPVTDISNLFTDCKNLVDASKINIPDTVTNMMGTFSGCSKLTTAPKIPENIKDMNGTFYDCTSLNSVIDLSKCTKLSGYSGTFANCISLTEKPIMPGHITQSESSYLSGCTQFGY